MATPMGCRGGGEWGRGVQPADADPRRRTEPGESGTPEISSLPVAPDDLTLGRFAGALGTPGRATRRRVRRMVLIEIKHQLAAGVGV